MITNETLFQETLMNMQKGGTKGLISTVQESQWPEKGIFQSLLKFNTKFKNGITIIHRFLEICIWQWPSRIFIVQRNQLTLKSLIFRLTNKPTVHCCKQEPRAKKSYAGEISNSHCMCIFYLIKSNKIESFLTIKE